MGVSVEYLEKATKDGRIVLHPRLSIYSPKYGRTYKALPVKISSDESPNTRKEKKRLIDNLRNHYEAMFLASEHELFCELSANQRLVDYAKSKAEETQPKSFLRKSLKYMEEFFDSAKLKDISVTKAEKYQSFLSRSGLKDSTVEHYVMALNHLFEVAIKEHVYTHNPVKEIKKIRAKESSVDYLTDEELSLLHRAPIMGESGLGCEIKKAFLVCCHTGLRLSDVRELRYSDLASAKITICQRKTQRLVHIPVHSEVYSIIGYSQSQCIGDKHRVFPELATTKTNINQYLCSWGKNAGLTKKLHFHVSRHTMAMRAYRACHDIYRVKNLLGHSKISNTERYAKVEAADLVDVICSIPCIRKESHE